LKKVKIDLTAPPRGKEPEPPELKKFGLKPGMPAEARPILDARSTILRYIKNQGFPLATAEEPKVIVDHKDRTLSVTYLIAPGPRAAFGTIDIKGEVSVEPSFILEKLPWEPGDTFKADLLDRARSNLLKTGLFSVVRFQLGDSLDSQGRLPMTLQLTERKHKTLKLGLGYNTDEEILGRVDWENRNILHRGESLRLLSHASGIGLALEGGFTKPGFFRPDQDLILNLRLADEYPDAYASRNITGLAQVKRDLGRGMTLGLGPALTLSNVEQFGEQRHFQLISLPLAYDWDRRDDILDPAKGGNLTSVIAPYYDFFGESNMFYRGLVQYSQYFKVPVERRIVLALRGTLGFLGGSDLADIPADTRFYAGGGGSIRGYAYQSVGPLFGDKLVPFGGRSLLTLSSEIRIRITKKIGLVPFVDGGNVFAAEFPDYSQRLFWGAGLGLRYITGIGPLRLDVAFPLNKRETDKPFQVYISLGQAF
jgi:translocation and assembly module TamA